MIESKKLVFKLYLIFFFLIVCFSGFSQNIISGNVTSIDNEPISGVSVTITDVHNNIKGFSITNPEGEFSVSVSSDFTHITINLKHISYSSISQPIENKTQNLTFMMDDATTEIQEVIIENRPIRKDGDTISYSVGSFAEQKDRSIGDVLSKMPGIDVLSDGRILYQGRPIEKYYIEGMDLLEGKYNLANNNLPYNVVRSVEILENHQPIRMLDSLVSSDRTSLNIRLKDEIVTTGVAKIGSGVSPLLWEANLTPMFFKKNKQAIVSYQANNIGYDSSSELKTLTIEDLLEQIENPVEKSDLMSLIKPELPDISSKRYLDNNIHMLTANYLTKLKNQTEIRINASYVNDNQILQGENHTQYFLPTGDVILEEKIQNNIFANDLQTNFTIYKNTKESYLKNSFKTQLNWEGQKGIIDNGNEVLSHQLNNPYYSISNNLKWTTSIKKQLFSVYSYFGLHQTPQSLVINPGQFTAILNNNTSYNATEQKVKKNVFQTNNFVEFIKPFKRFTLNNKAGFGSVFLNHSTDILADDMAVNGDFKNRLTSRIVKFYYQPSLDYKNKKWNFNIQLPLSYNTILVEDSDLEKQRSANGIVLNPYFRIKYDINGYWAALAGSSFSDDFQNPESILFGYFMNNYRNIQITDYPIQRIQNTTNSIGLNYRNPINSMFFHSKYALSQTKNPFIFQYDILDDGSRILSIADFENTRTNHNFMSKVSKYFSRIRTTLSVGFDLNFQFSNQLVNNNFVKVSSNSYNPNLSLNTRFNDVFSIDYNIKNSFSSNKIQTSQRQKTHTLSENLMLNIYPNNAHYIGISFEHYYNDFISDNNNNFYFDISYRYTFSESKIDLEINCMNLFNENKYISSNFSNVQFSQNIFVIRPRQIVAGVRFNF